MLLVSVYHFWYSDVLRATAPMDFYADEAISKVAIRWEECGDSMVECGRLKVPMDYFDAGAGNAILAVAKYPATVKKGERKLGTLFLNPGGPGASGRQLILQSGREMSELLDGKYDIVSWDPRGVGKTVPRVKCPAGLLDEDEDTMYMTNRGSLVWGDLSDPAQRAVFIHELKLQDARNRAVVRSCVRGTGEVALSHMGTSTAARDLERLATVIDGEDKPVNYWGFSYGTVLGSYFVNMFPDRVGRIVLDGVVDPEVWSGSHPITWGALDFVSAEDVFNRFIEICTSSGPDRCSIAPESKNPEDLRAKIDGLFETLRKSPLAGLRRVTSESMLITPAWLSSTIFSAMYGPSSWPLLVLQLELVILEASGHAAQLGSEPNVTILAQTDFALEAITCVDAAPYTAKESRGWLEEAVQSVEKALVVSPHFGALNAPDVCRHWPVREAEWYTGPFNSTTLASEILIVGNTHDPITPLVNAQRVHALLPQSVLLQHDADGHCSTAQDSLCTTKILRDYFLGGKLPSKREVFCHVGEPIFPDDEEEEDVGLWIRREREAEGVQAGLVDLTDEDERVMRLAKGFSDAWGKFQRESGALRGRW